MRFQVIFDLERPIFRISIHIYANDKLIADSFLPAVSQEKLKADSFLADSFLYDLLIIAAEPFDRPLRWLFGELVGPLLAWVNRPVLVAR